MLRTTCVLFILAFCITPALLAQDQVHVDSSAEIRIPADQVQFVITITTTDETPSRAFQQHKRQEAFLADLIQDQNLSDHLLSFEPITLQQRQVREERHFRTRQQVQLRIPSLDQFEEIQMALAEHQFEQFQATFLAKGLEDAQDEALKQALKQAEEKARIIAETIGRNLGQIHEIQHSTNQGPGPVYRMEAFQVDASSSMMDFDATVPVSASVSVTYMLQ
ncbi:MAG: SIMPL domain-containing protein [Bacteroidota bacterium]